MNFIRPCDHKSPRAVALIVGVLGLIAILRLVSAYFIFSQAYDEPAHIACGMEWLDKGTLFFQPLHPPLARVDAAIGPYLAGGRLPPGRNLPKGRGQTSCTFLSAKEISENARA